MRESNQPPGRRLTTVHQARSKPLPGQSRSMGPTPNGAVVRGVVIRPVDHTTRDRRKNPLRVEPQSTTAVATAGSTPAGPNTTKKPLRGKQQSVIWANRGSLSNNEAPNPEPPSLPKGAGRASSSRQEPISGVARRSPNRLGSWPRQAIATTSRTTRLPPVPTRQHRRKQGPQREIAQLEEQRFPKPPVAGSNPALSARRRPAETRPAANCDTKGAVAMVM